MRETICITYRCEDELTRNTETVPLSVVTLDDHGRAVDIQTYERGHTSMRHRLRTDLIDIVTNVTYEYLYGEDE